MDARVLHISMEEQLTLSIFLVSFRILSALINQCTIIVLLVLFVFHRLSLHFLFCPKNIIIQYKPIVGRMGRNI